MGGDRTGADEHSGNDGEVDHCEGGAEGKKCSRVCCRLQKPAVSSILPLFSALERVRLSNGRAQSFNLPVEACVGLQRGEGDGGC